MLYTAKELFYYVKRVQNSLLIYKDFTVASTKVIN